VRGPAECARARTPGEVHRRWQRLGVAGRHADVLGGGPTRPADPGVVEPDPLNHPGGVHPSAVPGGAHQPNRANVRCIRALCRPNNLPTRPAGSVEIPGRALGEGLGLLVGLDARPRRRSSSPARKDVRADARIGATLPRSLEEDLLAGQRWRTVQDRRVTAISLGAWHGCCEAGLLGWSGQQHGGHGGSGDHDHGRGGDQRPAAPAWCGGGGRGEIRRCGHGGRVSPRWSVGLLLGDRYRVGKRCSATRVWRLERLGGRQRLQGSLSTLTASACSWPRVRQNNPRRSVGDSLTARLWCGRLR
jgi:hypothetical protein